MPPQLLVDVSAIDPSKPILDKRKIGEILPHRGAMALLDGVSLIERESMLVGGWKDVRPDEFWNAGHFPGNPILPGIVIVEACAQLSLIGYKAVMPEISDRLVLFGGIDNVRFRGAVKPGDRLILIAKMTEVSRRGARSLTQAVVTGKLVYEGEVFAVTA